MYIIVKFLLISITHSLQGIFAKTRSLMLKIGLLVGSKEDWIYFLQIHRLLIVEIDLLGKSEFLDDVAVVCNAASVTPLGGPGACSPMKF